VTTNDESTQLIFPELLQRELDRARPEASWRVLLTSLQKEEIRAVTRFRICVTPEQIVRAGFLSRAIILSVGGKEIGLAVVLEDPSSRFAICDRWRELYDAPRDYIPDDDDYNDAGLVRFIGSLERIRGHPISYSVTDAPFCLGRLGLVRRMILPRRSPIDSLCMVVFPRHVGFQEWYLSCWTSQREHIH
jgi:hypothetical protein